MTYASPSAAIAVSGAAVATSARAAATAAFTASHPPSTSDRPAGKTILLARNIKPPHVIPKPLSDSVGFQPPLLERVIIASARVLGVGAPPLFDRLHNLIRRVDSQACENFPQCT